MSQVVDIDQPLTLTTVAAVDAQGKVVFSISNHPKYTLNSGHLWEFIQLSLIELYAELTSWSNIHPNSSEIIVSVVQTAEDIKGDFVIGIPRSQLVKRTLSYAIANHYGWTHTYTGQPITWSSEQGLQCDGKGWDPLNDLTYVMGVMIKSGVAFGWSPGAKVTIAGAHTAERYDVLEDAVERLFQHVLGEAFGDHLIPLSLARDTSTVMDRPQ